MGSNPVGGAMTLFPELEEQFIGTTETYDPAFDDTWYSNLKKGNIIITKRLTDYMIYMLLSDYNIYRCILHLVCTGYGNSPIEPHVPTIEFNKRQLTKLLSLGFPLEQVVLRISPIIPNEKGITLALDVIDEFKEFNIKRIRFSTLNVYKHVAERFLKEGIELPYYTYSAPKELRDNLLKALANHLSITLVDEFSLDCCAEINLDTSSITKTGCISNEDLKILGIEKYINLQGVGKQRDTCLCPNNKKQIIRRKPARCPHQCLYCYWKD